MGFRQIFLRSKTSVLGLVVLFHVDKSVVVWKGLEYLRFCFFGITLSK